MLLNSMKVVSFCHVLQGPAATQYLGDMGADIIKIEPLAGERARRWLGTNMGGVSGLYVCAFRNKKLFSVDIKSPEGYEIVMGLIEKADVVVENYRQGVMDRLGLGYEDIKKRNPGIIYASGTGWGTVGPMRTRESQDLIVQARAGLASATGLTVDQPRAAGSAIVDQHAGALLAMGVAAAYARKLATGEGTKVEASLFAAGLDLQTEPLTVYMSKRPGLDVFKRDPHIATWYHQAPYGIYRTADAEIAVSTNPVAKMAEALNSPELQALADRDGYADRDEIARVFADVLSTRSYAHVSAAFDAQGIWYGPVQTYDDLATDPQIEAMSIFREIDVNGAKAVVVNHPNRYDGQVPELRVAGYTIGEHTREILLANGYSDAQVDDLAARNIIRAA